MRNAIRYQVTLPLLVGGLRLTPDSQPGPGEPKALAVEVIYTTDEGTKHALQEAWALAQDLGAHVRLVYVYAIPYTLPLGKPAISLPFVQNKLVKLAGDFPGEASVHIFLCREALRAIQDALPKLRWLSWAAGGAGGGRRRGSGWKVGLRSSGTR